MAELSSKRITLYHSNKRQPLVRLLKQLALQYPDACLKIHGTQGRWKLRGLCPPLPDKPCINLYSPL